MTLGLGQQILHLAQTYEKIILAVIVLALLGGYALTQKESVEYTAPQVVEKEVEVDALEQAIKSAQNGKQEAIRATAQKAYDEAYAQEMKKWSSLKSLPSLTKTRCTTGRARKGNESLLKSSGEHHPSH